MKPLYLLACLLVSSSLSAQNIYEYISFNPLVEDTCGSGNAILRPEHFIAYQTIDNTQDGEIDPETCVEWGSWELLLTGADLSRPVFVRLVDFELSLPPNDLLMFSNFYNEVWSNDSHIDWGNQDFCFDGLCNGLEVRVEVPSEDGEGLNERVWQQEFSPVPDEIAQWSLIATGFSMCVPTEDFEEQQLNELVLKFMFVEGVDSIEMYGLEIASREGVFEVSNSNLSDYQNAGGYEFDGWGWSGSADFVFLYDAGGYPSETNVSYVEFFPPQNPSTLQTIQLLFGEDDNYTLQPFTQFRGGLVEGEDELRHNLEIVNEGATFCFNSYIDFTVDNGSRFVHHGGKLEFQGGRSCMQLSGGATFVLSSPRLNYGQVGQGMFALYGGSNILLEPNSHLHFDGKMLLANHAWDAEFVPVVMTLKEGAKLSFSEFAKLEDLSEGKTKLLIRNQGGEVDLTNLTEAERASIEIITEAVETKQITLLGNPVATDGDLSFLLFEEGEATVRVLDANGKRMLESEMGADSPLIKLPLKGMPAGAYLLQVKQQAEIRTERFVIN